jgi:hypothetical protein
MNTNFMLYLFFFIPVMAISQRFSSPPTSSQVQRHFISQQQRVQQQQAMHNLAIMMHG